MYINREIGNWLMSKEISSSHAVQLCKCNKSGCPSISFYLNYKPKTSNISFNTFPLFNINNAELIMRDHRISKKELPLMSSKEENTFFGNL